ncbi:MAG: rRNA maturation RNase YbeY [Propylenella sp.]
MKLPRIEIAVEAGEWPAKRVLRRLAERAVGAAVRVVRAVEQRDHPSPNPSPHPATSERSRSGFAEARGGGERAAPRRLSPLPSAALELSIVFTDDAAMRKLNAKWRGKDKPTNVLAFPQGGGQWRHPSPNPSPQGGGESALLGDIVLAAETVSREAKLAELPLEDHMAHLIIHGFLHLLGYDHEAEADAEEMEQLERAALSRIGIPDPYAAAQRP